MLYKPTPEEWRFERSQQSRRRAPWLLIGGAMITGLTVAFATASLVIGESDADRILKQVEHPAVMQTPTP